MGVRGCLILHRSLRSLKLELSPNCFPECLRLARSPFDRAHPQAGEAPLLTEDQVQRSFRNLFKTKDFPAENFDKAENLLDELRAESPLRHRLSVELEELRKMSTAKAR
jgi:hypothetical protein